VAPAQSAPPDLPLAAGSLAMPVEGIRVEQLIDTYTQARGAGRSHDAIDIMAPSGTRVFAVDDGKIAKLFNSKPGGITIYQFDRAEKVAYYYAHLSAYAPDLAEGQVVKRGELIGFVGSTGNASTNAPHLHFAVFVLGPEKRWWEGTAVNPFPLLGGK
jgi:murein DD-endopeptidase MepM/ murein hydrolase activator NlpD